MDPETAASQHDTCDMVDQTMQDVISDPLRMLTDASLDAKGDAAQNGPSDDALSADEITNAAWILVNIRRDSKRATENTRNTLNNGHIRKHARHHDHDDDHDNDNDDDDDGSEYGGSDSRKTSISANGGSAKRPRGRPRAVRPIEYGSDTAMSADDHDSYGPSGNPKRPYKCLQCSQTFISRAHALRHQSKHSGIRPFKCPHPGCGKTFSRKDNAAFHYRRQHGGE